MGVEIDKITVTFYDTDECRIATEFRTKALKRYRSLNDALKELIKDFLKNEQQP